MSVVQFDMDWKVRHQQRGGHIHMDLFSRKRGQATYQNCGHLVIGENEWVAFRLLMPSAEFEERVDGC